jgi:FKBP-type peptidyl-prolyl cis-trans isomerase 2
MLQSTYVKLALALALVNPVWMVAVHAEEVAPATTPATEAGTPPVGGVAIAEHMRVGMDYTLTVDGAVIDTSTGRKPLEYVQGSGQIIPGLERQLVGLRVGDEREVTVSPEDGYGAVNPAAISQVSKTQLPKDVTPNVGMMLQGTTAEGRPFRATIREVHPDGSVTVDMNHPLAGKTLHFKIKIVSVDVSL